MTKTIVLSAGVEVPLNVATEALANRASTILKRELAKAAEKAVQEFVANGITEALAKAAVDVQVESK